MMARASISGLLAIVLLASCAWGGEPEFSPLFQRRAMFRVRQDVRQAERAVARLELLPWQREAVQLLLDEQSRAADLFRLGSDLQGREFEAKIQELIEVTHDKIALALSPGQQAEWSRLMSPRSLSFAARRILARGTPAAPPEP